jgi:hypothetical protein
VTVSIISIGIDVYHYLPEAQRLWKCCDDAERVLELLRSSLKTNRGILLSDGSLVGKLPTRAEIYRSVLNGQFHEGASVVFLYFCGHALTIENRLLLCPIDFDPEIPEITGIHLDDLVGRLSRLCDAIIVVIVDACRKNFNTSSSVPDTLTPLAVMNHRTFTLFACDYEQYSHEVLSDGDISGGIFTHFLCLEFRKRLRRQRRVKFANLFEAVKLQTAEYAAERLNVEQQPSIFGPDVGDFFLERP